MLHRRRASAGIARAARRCRSGRSSRRPCCGSRGRPRRPGSPRQRLEDQRGVEPGQAGAARCPRAHRCAAMPSAAASRMSSTGKCRPRPIPARAARGAPWRRRARSRAAPAWPRAGRRRRPTGLGVERHRVSSGRRSRQRAGFVQGRDGHTRPGRRVWPGDRAAGSPGPPTPPPSPAAPARHRRLDLAPSAPAPPPHCAP